MREVVDTAAVALEYAERDIARHGRFGAERGSSGATLVEVLVALAVLSTVVAAVIPFLVQSLVVVDRQRSLQAGVQVASEGVEQARASRAPRCWWVAAG